MTPHRLAELRDHLAIVADTQRKQGACTPLTTIMTVAEVVALIDALERCRGVLKRVEYGGTIAGGECYSCCPSCRSGPHDYPPHTPDCALAAALREGR